MNWFSIKSKNHEKANCRKQLLPVTLLTMDVGPEQKRKLTCINGLYLTTGWQSGLRHCVKAAVSADAWVRIPLLSIISFITDVRVFTRWWNCKGDENNLPFGTVFTNSCQAIISPSFSILKVWLTLEATKKQKGSVHSVVSNLNLQKTKRRPATWSEGVLEKNATYLTKRESLLLFRLSLALDK